MSVISIRSDSVRLPKRPPDSSKRDYGHLLILGGSVGYTGAPTLCARAAVRCGAGLVSLGVPESIYAVTAVKNDEAMPFPLTGQHLPERLRRCSVLAVGPGMGRSNDARRLFLRLPVDKPTVADADALFFLAEETERFAQYRAPLIITPHEGEFARLFPDRSGDRERDCAAFTRRHGCVTVLKGHRTLVAFPDGTLYRIEAGNPGMARGGSGDILTGILGAMLCQLPLKQAVLTGCCLHAAAGDAAAEALGEYGMIPTDILRYLPQVMQAITE